MSGVAHGQQKECVGQGSFQTESTIWPHSLTNQDVRIPFESAAGFPSSYLAASAATSSFGAAFLATAPAKVFLSNPFDITPVEVLLEGLHNAGNQLDGQYVRAGSDRLDGAGAASGINGQADYRFEADTTEMKLCSTDLSKCPAFDPVNVYYHVDRYARDYWVDQMGVDISFQAQARVHSGGDGAFADPPNWKIVFRVGDIFSKNAALSNDLIYHEYTHLVTHSLGFEIDSGGSEETSALSEGYADYFTMSYTDDPQFGEWVVTCPDRQQCLGSYNGRENDTEIRTAELLKHTWNWNFGLPDPTLQYGYCLRFHELDLKCKESFNNPDHAHRYTWGMIWAAMLWDFRKMVGQEVADRIAIEAVRRHNSESGLDDAARDLVAAEQTLYLGIYASELSDALSGRGFPYEIVDSIDENTLPHKDGLTVWPNPTLGSSQFTFTSNRAGNMTYRLLDMSGKEILNQSAGWRAAGSHDERVDINGLASGVYLLSVRVDGGHVASSKIVVAK